MMRILFERNYIIRSDYLPSYNLNLRRKIRQSRLLSPAAKKLIEIADFDEP